MIRLLILCLAMATLTGCNRVTVYNALQQNPDARTEIVRNVAYGEEARQRMDLYVPASEGPHPILIFVYGGYWNWGGKGDYAFVGKRFAAEGFLTAVIDYRQTPENMYPDFIEDAAKSAAFLYKNASAYGADRERVFMTGHSSGAFNVAVLAMRPEFLRAEGVPEDIIDAVAPMGGGYNMNTIPLDGLDMEKMEMAMGEYLFQPNHQPALISRKTPPPAFLLVHGAGDEYIPQASAREMAAWVRAQGGRAEVTDYPGVNHTQPLMAIAQPQLLTTVDDMVRFFNEVAPPR